MPKLGPQKAAHTILDVFLHEFEGRPGRTVKTKAFYAIWVKRGLALAEFNGGMAYANRLKWVEILELEDSYRITDKGYEKTIPSEYKKPAEPPRD
jgi:hypothetical protein